MFFYFCVYVNSTIRQSHSFPKPSSLAWGPFRLLGNNTTATPSPLCRSVHVKNYHLASLFLIMCALVLLIWSQCIYLCLFYSLPSSFLCFFLLFTSYFSLLSFFSFYPFSFSFPFFSSCLFLVLVPCFVPFSSFSPCCLFPVPFFSSFLFLVFLSSRHSFVLVSSLSLPFVFLGNDWQWVSPSLLSCPFAVSSHLPRLSSRFLVSFLVVTFCSTIVQFLAGASPDCVIV